MGRIVGIDLGTTNSCVAVLEGGVPVVIPNELGAPTTPSAVAYTAGGGILIGAPARRQAVTNPRATLLAVKRLIGRRYASPVVNELRRTMPYAIVPAKNLDAWIEVAGQTLSPPEVSAHVLRHLKNVAEAYLGEEVTGAVVTVPAYFDDVQRQATKDAGTIAGLEVRAILNEPTAAAFAYGVHKKPSATTFAVFDLGGGTFDVSILRIENGVYEVLATSGDTFLGGDDFDRAVVERLLSDFRMDTGVDLTEDPAALQRLRESAERAKQELSDTTETSIHLPFIGVGPDGPLHLAYEATRSWLEELVEPLLRRLEGPCHRALDDAGLKPHDIEQVVLVGGMTRMPAVERRVVEIFGKRPAKGVNPDEVVAVGAATHAAVIGQDAGEATAVLLDVTSQSLGIKTVGDKTSVIIPRNTTVPCRESKIFKTTDDDQAYVILDVVQGDAPTASENRLLGNFELGDLPKGRSGTVQVSVVFTIDADGILEVHATETRTGKTTSQRILASSGLGRSEVQAKAQAQAQAQAARAEPARRG